MAPTLADLSDDELLAYEKQLRHQLSAGFQSAKRRTLYEKMGWDCKAGAHLLRLLRMGIEFLNDGQLYVLRHDAPQLLEIKRGEWGLERVKAEADHLFKLAEEAYVRSTLPVSPDMDKVNKLAVSVIETALKSSEK